MDVEILVNEERTQCKLQMDTPEHMAMFFETVMMVVAGVIARYALNAEDREPSAAAAPFVAGAAPPAGLLRGQDGLRVARLPRHHPDPADAASDAQLEQLLRGEHQAPQRDRQRLRDQADEP